MDKWHTCLCKVHLNGTPGAVCSQLTVVNRCELVATSIYFPLFSPLFSSCCFPGSVLAAKHINLSLVEKVKIFAAFDFAAAFDAPHGVVHLQGPWIIWTEIEWAHFCRHHSLPLKQRHPASAQVSLFVLYSDHQLIH